MKVSLYKNIKDLKGVVVEELHIFKGIQGGKWMDQQERVRACDKGTDKYDIEKRGCVNYAACGVFSHRENKNIVEHSGRIALDIDRKGNEGIDFEYVKNQLKNDTYTYVVSNSIGGDGFFTLVKIPADTNTHESSFRALREYYADAYGIKVDPSCKNVSRVRYLPYDPNIYINPESVTFEEFLDEEIGFVPIPENTYTPANSEDYGQQGLARAVKLVLEANDGEKHNQLNKAGFLAGGYVAGGHIGLSEAEWALKNAIRQLHNVKNLQAADKTIEKAIKDGMSKPVIPDTTQYIVRTKRNAGVQKDAIVGQLVATQGLTTESALAIVESIHAEQDVTIETFWNVTWNDQKKKDVLTLSRPKYIEFLEKSGFRKYFNGKDYDVVRVENNIVETVDRGRIKDFVMNYIRQLPFEFDGVFKIVLVDQIQKENRTFFDQGIMEFLKSLDAEFVRDTINQSHFFFKNGFVQVTKEAVKLIPYTELKGLIWKDQVIDREFTKLTPEQLAEAEFCQFLWNVTTSNIDHINKAYELSKDRCKALMSGIGYILHGYKDPSNPRVLILVDEQISDAPSGGTGKGLIFQAIKQMRPTVVLDGKTFDFKDKFALQNVKESTRLVVFEDWDGKRLAFDRLFNMTTNELKINRLYLGQISIQYSDSPKFAITTNDMVSGEGDSHARRKFEVEIAPYYSAKFNPKDDFGHVFFNDWDAEEWNRFDNLMLECCNIFLDIGLFNSAPVNLNRRKLLQATSPEFAEYCDEIPRGEYHNGTKLWGAYIEQYKLDIKLNGYPKFIKRLKLYAEFEGLEFSQFQEKTLGENFNQKMVKIG